MFKRKKILKYLNEKPRLEWAAFDGLLNLYLNGKLKASFAELGIKKIKLSVDWLSSYKCINIQGKIGDNYLDLQIEPSEFNFGLDPIEPDDHFEYPLQSINQLFSLLKEAIETK